MKTSNYIVCAFFTVFIGSFFLLFIRALKHDNFVEENNVKASHILNDFAVVVVQAKERLYVESGDTCKLEFEYMENNEIPEISYQQSNDTLFLNNIPEGTKLFAQRLEAIVANEGSHTEFNIVFAENLQIKASHANVRCFDSRITNLNIEAIHSYITVDGDVGTLSAQLTDSSCLRSNSYNKVTVERDSTSEYSLH